MSIIEILFWFITVPGAYIAIACLVYWILLKIYKDCAEDDLKCVAGFWVLIVPLWVVFVTPMKLFNALFDMVGGKK